MSQILRVVQSINDNMSFLPMCPASCSRVRIAWVKDNLIVIKGNCDSAVDTMISEFDFFEHLLLSVNNKTFFLTHGHIYNKDSLPKTKVDGIIYGHFHTGFIEEENGVIVVNAGSTSLPKGETENSYLVLEDSSLTLKNFEGKIIKSLVL